jgi:hypothetical protein
MAGNAQATGTNGDLAQLHKMLIAANQTLNSKLDRTSDPDLADKIVTEMREVVHRIDLVQSLLFTAASVGIAAAVADVKTANDGLAASIAAIGKATELVDTVTKFLTLVDTAIDLAKKIP